MCTIHQPSAVLLELFDQLLLLEQPGKTVYFGPLGKGSETMIRYFEGLGARPCLQGENPGDWVLEVTQQALPGSANWSTLWDQSPEKAALMQEVDSITVGRGTAEAKSGKRFAVSPLSQVYEVSRRMTLDLWRTPTDLWSMFMLCFGTVGHYT